MNVWLTWAHTSQGPQCLRPMGIAKLSLTQAQGIGQPFLWSAYRCEQCVQNLTTAAFFWVETDTASLKQPLT